MTIAERQAFIKADRTTVWNVIADLGAVAGWNPGVESAECEPIPYGIGVTRSCQLRAGGIIKEIVTEWVPEQEIWLAVGNHGAIRSADLGLVLADTIDPSTNTEATSVRAIADWHLNYGPIGPVVDRLTVRRLMGRMLDTTVDGLKSHIEARISDNATP